MIAGAALQVVLVAEPLDGSWAVEALFGDIPVVVLPLGDLRVVEPWRGRLFEEVAALVDICREADAGDAAIGLLVPIAWTGPGPEPEAVLIADHVNLTLRGPLSGRRPDGGPPSFVDLAGQYQPQRLRPRLAGRVYCEVAVAGVADAGRLTRFEAREVTRSGCPAVADHLVDAVIVAAHHGLRVAACGLPRAAMSDRAHRGRA